MKVLGISGSPRKDSVTDQLVKTVLDACDCESHFLSLSGKIVQPCVACLGCVRDNTCVLKDDMRELRELLVEADAYVIGAPNYFGMLNAMTHSFLERWYQFRHREGKMLSGKLGVAVGVGGGMPEEPAKNIQTFFQYNQIECVGTVCAQGPASCFVCGYGEDCAVGAVHMFYGAGTKITDDMIPSLAKQPDVLAKARELGQELSCRFKRFAAGT